MDSNERTSSISRLCSCETCMAARSNERTSSISRLCSCETCMAARSEQPSRWSEETKRPVNFTPPGDEEILERAVLTQFRRRAESVEAGQAVLSSLDAGAPPSMILASFVHSSWNMVLMEVSSKYPCGLAVLDQLQHSHEMKVRAADQVFPILFSSLAEERDRIIGEVAQDLRQRMDA
jgi:hypothetical protein